MTPTVISIPLALAPVVSVVIPTKSRDRTLAALASVAGIASCGIALETIVVVNGAPDVAHELRDCTRGVRIVESRVNRGLPGAMNLGRASAVGEFVLMLHDDSLLSPEWLSVTLAAAREHPDAGVVAGTVLSPDGSLQGVGWLIFSDGITMPPWRGEPPPASAFSVARRVDYASSSALLVRASNWDAIGGLDERLYPGYYVDVDLAFATRRAGSCVLFVPGATSHHVKGASTELAFRTFVAERNRPVFLAKWADDLAELPPPDTSLDLAQLIAAADQRPLRVGGVVPVHGSPFDDEWYEATAATLAADYARHLEEQRSADSAAQVVEPAAQPTPRASMIRRLARRLVRARASGRCRPSPPANRSGGLCRR
ncbi:MAG: glycosyltransferase family 2 protein [Actinomycetota bacterium]|nr:glycosyltransferase family 2 protein [Actinomycetota bacterium]